MLPLISLLVLHDHEIHIIACISPHFTVCLKLEDCGTVSGQNVLLPTVVGRVDVGPIATEKQFLILSCRGAW